MKNNLILQSLTQLKSKPSPELAELFNSVEVQIEQAEQIEHSAESLGNQPSDQSDQASDHNLSAYLLDEDDDGFEPCPDVVVNHLLEAVRIHFRGLREGESLPLQIPTGAQDNNTILKKIRIALNLQAEELDDIFETAGLSFSRHEISAMFRKPGHKHFKKCTDKMLMALLQGLRIWASRG